MCHDPEIGALKIPNVTVDLILSKIRYWAMRMVWFCVVVFCVSLRHHLCHFSATLLFIHNLFFFSSLFYRDDIYVYFRYFCDIFVTTTFHHEHRILSSTRTFYAVNIYEVNSIFILLVLRMVLMTFTFMSERREKNMAGIFEMWTCVP